METFGNKKTPKNPKIFYCKLCNFKCSNKKDWTRHNLTAKHKRKLLETDPTYTKIPNELTGMLTNIENNGAPWQFSQNDRLNWANEE